MPPFMPPPPALCEHCKRPIVACDADKKGCGTTPATAAPVKDANVADEDPPSGYMSRPKML